MHVTSPRIKTKKDVSRLVKQETLSLDGVFIFESGKNIDLYSANGDVCAFLIKEAFHEVVENI